MRSLSIITPTGDRYESLRLLFKFLMNQTFFASGGLADWIVVDDGETDAAARAVSEFSDSDLANLGIQVFHIQARGQKYLKGPRSLGANMLHGLDLATSSKILVMEDDDCYLPGYLDDMFRRLEGSWAVGTVWQKYYHLPSRSYRIFRNRGSALCSTGFAEALKPDMKAAAKHCLSSGCKGLDAFFWSRLMRSGRKLDIFEPEQDLMIGMKGMPGRSGIGVGHRPKKFKKDPNLSILREWVGPYFDDYKEFVGE
jgi:glycosyltransferase involved in cell wall biosynthesis